MKAQIINVAYLATLLDGGTKYARYDVINKFTNNKVCSISKIGVTLSTDCEFMTFKNSWDWFTNLINECKTELQNN